MTSSTLLIVAIAGLVIAGLAATAAKVLNDYSRRELELYCQRRNRLDLFGEILDEDEQVLLAVDSLQVIGVVLLVLSGTLWYYESSGASGPPDLVRFLASATLISVLTTAVVNWIPAAIVQLWAAPFLYRFWKPLRVTSEVLKPLTSGVGLVGAFLRRLADRPESEEDEEEAFEDEIRSIVTEGLHEGLLEEDALEMIEGVIELGDTDVSDIMTPRSNVDACDAELDWSGTLQFIVEAGRTRFPVYEGNLDNVVGILYVKDLLGELSSDAPRKELRALLREPLLVPTTKRLDEMLQEFQQTHNHLAIVVDEYRAVAGVVTIEDVLEEIVGEIVDESDKEQVDEIRTLDDRTSEVLGTAHIDVVNDRLGLELPDPEEVDTIAGLLIRQLGRIPKPGESVAIDGAQITVTGASRRRVEKLRIEKAVDAN